MSADGATYLDSSAFVKLIVIEPESHSLVAHLRSRGRLVSCALLRVEAVRAVRREAPSQIAAAERALAQLDLVPLGDGLLSVAAAIEDAALRSLDAIHVAAARSLGTELAELITYNRRMVRAAEDLGLPVAAPA